MKVRALRYIRGSADSSRSAIAHVLRSALSTTATRKAAGATAREPAARAAGADAGGVDGSVLVGLALDDDGLSGFQVVEGAGLTGGDLGTGRGDLDGVALRVGHVEVVAVDELDLAEGHVAAPAAAGVAAAAA